MEGDTDKGVNIGNPFIDLLFLRVMFIRKVWYVQYFSLELTRLTILRKLSNKVDEVN